MHLRVVCYHFGGEDAWLSTFPTFVMTIVILDSDVIVKLRFSPCHQILSGSDFFPHEAARSCHRLPGSGYFFFFFPSVNAAPLTKLITLHKRQISLVCFKGFKWQRHKYGGSSLSCEKFYTDGDAWAGRWVRRKIRRFPQLRTSRRGHPAFSSHLCMIR